jgi:hypothetical protein
MAISSVRAKINGTWYTLTYDSTSGAYKANITASLGTSYVREGGYYNVTLEATNTAGTTTTVDATDFSGLKLYVRETTPPGISVQSPSSGAYVTNNKQPVIFMASDEQDGSGINPSSAVITLDGTAVPASAVSVVKQSGDTYKITYTPVSALTDGNHTVTAKISDNDGNQSAAASTTYKVDTVPPTLNITAPANNLITNAGSLTVTGTTNDATASPVTISMTLNSTSQGTVTVATNGSFSKAITLKSGTNTIVVTATDAAGKTSSVTRTVTLDTSAPVIKSVSIAPNPVDSGGTIVISVVIE